MKFYNEVVKNRYLETIENEASRTVISYIFTASKGAEENVLGKDLYNFSLEEIAQIMYNMSPKTSNSARGNMNNIKNYISWCIRNGYRDNNINPLDGLSREWYSKFVDRKSKIHYSDEELEDFLEELHNAQDQAMIQLWFEGVGGKQFSELKNLSYYDVDWNNNIVNLKDADGLNRELVVSDRCMRYLQNAYRQQTYITIKDGGELNEIPLFDSNFIFRNINYKVTKEKEVSNGVIYRRLANIKEQFDLDILSYNSIKQSGQIHMAAEIYKRDGYFGEKEQWYEIGERYKVSTVTSDDRTYPNVRLMKEYINSDTLKELYDIGVEISIRKRSNRK